MYKNAFELRVCVNGKPVKEYSYKGKTFIEAKEGSRYTLKLSNNSSTRTMATFSVDGIDVIKGKPAEKTKSGYVIEPYSSIDIKGYRVSDNEGAEFVFFRGGDSYAAGRGKAYNNGVVGVRLTAEKIIHHTSDVFIQNPPWWNPPVWPKWKWNHPQPFTGGYSDNTLYRDTTGEIPMGMKGGSVSLNSCNVSDTYSCDMTMKSSDTSRRVQKQLLVEQSPVNNHFDLGTGWGDRIHDPVKRVEFDMGDVIGDLEILYASRQALESMGIDFNSSKRIVVGSSTPKAFNDDGYCEPPRNWNK